MLHLLHVLPSLNSSHVTQLCCLLGTHTVRHVLSLTDYLHLIYLLSSLFGVNFVGTLIICTLHNNLYTFLLYVLSNLFTAELGTHVIIRVSALLRHLREGKKSTRDAVSGILCNDLLFG